MIESIEHQPALPVRQKKLKKKLLLTDVIQEKAPATETGKGNKSTKQDNELTIRFNEWIMPPQPEAYLKCPRHDFF